MVLRLAKTSHIVMLLKLQSSQRLAVKYLLQFLEAQSTILAGDLVSVQQLWHLTHTVTHSTRHWVMVLLL